MTQTQSQPKKQFLLQDVMAYPPNENIIYHTGRIKVVSEEQYVPLYLANYANNPLTDTGRGSTRALPLIRNTSTSLTDRLVYVDTANKIFSHDRELVKSAVLKDLEGALRTTFPKEYSFVNIGGELLTDRGGAVGSANLSKYFTKLQRSLCLINTNQRIIVGLGIMATVGFSNTHSSNRSSYYSGYNTKSPNYKITPEVLVIVKYKYLPIIRASLYLEMPIELPYTSIRLLRNKVINNSAISLAYKDIISSFEKLEINPEYTTHEEMNAFLTLPIGSKTREQCLVETRQLLQQNEPHVIF